MTRPKLDTPEDVREWACGFDTLSSVDWETAVYVAQCVRLRQTLDAACWRTDSETRSYAEAFLDLALKGNDDE